jgi:integrase
MKSIERAKGTIRFAFKEPIKVLQKNSNKESLLYLFFSFGSKRFKYSTGYSCTLNDWDINKQRVRNKAHIHNRGEINDFLNRLELELRKEVTRMDSSGITITIDHLKGFLDNLTKKETLSNQQENVQLFDYFEIFLKRKEGRIKAVTLRSYRQTLRLLKEFNVRLTFEEINHDFYDHFISFLEMSEKSKNTISKHFKNLKVVLNSATRDGYNQNLMYSSSDFKVSTEVTSAIYLDEAELKKIMNLDLQGFPDLDRARDIFLIGCHTGQRVSDYNGLGEDNIFIKDGIRFFKIIQKKTGKEVLCPVTKEIDTILNKPINKGLPPKKMNEPDINEFIKEVGRKAGLDHQIQRTYTKGGKQTIEKVPKYKLIGTHTARRSFCTNMYKKGMPIYEIMHFSGHSTEKEFYKYIRIEREERALNLAKSGYFNL